MSKYCQEITKEICDHLENGANRTDTMVLVDISKETFYEWMRAKPDFADSVKKAEQKCKQFYIGVIKKAAEKSWQAAAWWLERKHHEEFSQKHETDGKREEETAMRLATKTLELMAKFNANGIIKSEPARV